MGLYICTTLHTVLSSDIFTYQESPVWTKNLASLAINAFDVFRPSFEDPSMFKDPPSLVLIRQPPSPFFRKPAGGETTFLNTTEEGAWYALSTDRFPLLTSRVRPAPWAIEPHKDRNATREDLVGIHPIARTGEMNVDNPGLPAPNLPQLIEGGDWQSRNHMPMGSLKQSALILLALLGGSVGREKSVSCCSINLTMFTDTPCITHTIYRILCR